MGKSHWIGIILAVVLLIMAFVLFGNIMPIAYIAKFVGPINRPTTN